MGLVSRGTSAFCLRSQLESTLKGKNLLLEEQILSFKCRFHFGSTMSYKEVKQDITTVASLCKKDGNIERYPYSKHKY